MARFGSHEMLRICIVVLSFALGLGSLTSCEKKNPTVDEKLVDAFVDIRTMEQTLGTDAAEARIARREILEKYGFTLETFKASVDNVLADKDLWVPFQKAVVARIDTLLHIPAPPPPKEKKK